MYKTYYVYVVRNGWKSIYLATNDRDKAIRVSRELEHKGEFSYWE